MPRKTAALVLLLVLLSIISVPLTLAQEDGHPDELSPDTPPPTPTPTPTPVDDPNTPEDESQTPTPGTQQPTGIGEGDDNTTGTQDNRSGSTNAQPLDVVPIAIVVVIAGAVGGAIAVFRKFGKSGEYVPTGPGAYPDAPPKDPTEF